MSRNIDEAGGIRENKNRLRSRIAVEERQISPVRRKLCDEALTQRLLDLQSFRQAKTVLLFSPFGAEPRLEGVFEACHISGKRLILPRMLPGNMLECREVCDPEHLVAGKYGIQEPDQTCPSVRRDDIEFILVPAVCYDRQGGRLGRGAGYYDRFLTGYAGKTAGLCRSCFLQEKLPLEEHDICVQIVITECETIFCGGRREMLNRCTWKED
ncbi:MAG: 5-formyltetrahydrofolate cyclo-ligase [Clostridia bacterium]|nr:5-formyltetrahydrofolate cyclo-ligase [Clostridia bacterium]